MDKTPTTPPKTNHNKNKMRIAHKISPRKGTKTHDKSSNNSKVKIVAHKIVSTVCEGDVVAFVGEANNGT
eukprot:scaffold16894_cov125-Skeletonema_dohrnii-CCMP3373.AAC.2